MKNTLRLVFGVMPLLAMTGCVTVPGSENVMVAKSAADITGCKLVGRTTATTQELKNRTILAGGDTVLIIGPDPVLGGGTATMYNCKGLDNRQPVPVSNPSPEKK